MFRPTLPTPPKPLTVQSDPYGDGVTDDGIEYRTFDLVRVHGYRVHRLASITVYADDRAPIVFAGAHEGTPANMKARGAARDYFNTIGANLTFCGEYWPL